jgi:hypothetical protein
MGHATISITLDRYGHLMPGHESEAAGPLDAHLAGRAPAGRRWCGGAAGFEATQGESILHG